MPDLGIVEKRRKCSEVYARRDVMRDHFRCGANRTLNSLSVYAISHCTHVQLCLRRTLVFGLVQPVDDDVGLCHAERIEVSPHRHRDLFLWYSSFRLRLSHGWGEATDALPEDDVAERVLERGRRVDAVRPSVVLQDSIVLGRPFDL
jgi:hypothetical protein